MRDTVVSFLRAINNGDYVAAFSILDKIVTVGEVELFSMMLEQIILWEGNPSRYKLKVRDCIAEYLGFGAVYFAILKPSYAIFKMVSGVSSRKEARDFLIQTVIELVTKNSPLVDLSFVEIDTLKETPYVVLIPYTLSKRAYELEGCKIPYSYHLSTSGEELKHRYCLADLQQTHYGRKILNAFNFDGDYPIIGQSDFLILQEILQSFGYDVSSMMVEVSEEDWSQLIMKRVQYLGLKCRESDEMWLLHTTYMAMIRFGSEDINIREEALRTIEEVETKHCNDALVPLLGNGTKSLNLRVIRIFESTHDYSKIDCLCSLIPESTGAERESLFKAISVIESAQYFTPGGIPSAQPRIETSTEIHNQEVTSRYLEALSKLSKASSPDAKIDSVQALSAFQEKGIENHLRRLMDDENPRVRFAVLEASHDLPKNQAADLVRLGLQDDDATIKNKALDLLEERWSDSYL
ncbi:MAG: HEAT repeat domain-containing protein [Candidatus Thorarchaeota archaeon SMTZ1-45]